MATNKGKTSAQSASNGEDDFLTGGTERTVAEIWQPVQPGEALIGKLISCREIRTKHSKGDGDLVPVAEFAPVVKRNADGSLEAFGSYAVILSAALRLRINAKTDVGHIFSIAFKGTEKIAGNKTQHNFDVVEQNDKKLAMMLEKCGAADDLPF